MTAPPRSVRLSNCERARPRKEGWIFATLKCIYCLAGLGFGIRLWTRRWLWISSRGREGANRPMAAADWPQMALATVASENRPGLMTDVTNCQWRVANPQRPATKGIDDVDCPFRHPAPPRSSLLAVNCPLFQALVLLSRPPSSEPCHASALSDLSPVFCCSPHPASSPVTICATYNPPPPDQLPRSRPKKYIREPSRSRRRPTAKSARFPSPPLTAMSVPCAA
jgi:hypothetical protein